jgi:hypothetical protein
MKRLARAVVTLADLPGIQANSPRASSSPARGGLGVVLAVLLACSAACGRVTIRSYYPNGQLRLLEGGNEPGGARVGLWVYYAADGSVQDVVTFGDGTQIEGTGVYAGGKRVRLATEQELADAQDQANLIMSQSARR